MNPNVLRAVAFAPTLAATPSYIRRAGVPISPRFPRVGGTTNGQTIGIDGATTTYTPIRSVLEAQAWGADSAVWSYTDRAASLGYASNAAYCAEFVNAGIPIQTATNSSAVSESTGPFAKDIAGYSFSAGGTSPRPSPLSSPTTSRNATFVSFAPANDTTGTKTPKLALIAAQLAAGATMLHMDDPRGVASLCGFRSSRSYGDLVSQTADFSATAVAGFPAWLSANTTSAQRIAVGIPSDPTGLVITDWLETNYSAILHSPGQSVPSLVDGYLFRLSVSNYESLRTVLLVWYANYLRDDQIAWMQQVKTATGVPFSLNLFATSPLGYMTWTVRQPTNPFDFAISEVPPPYWSQISAYTVGTYAWTQARWAQAGCQHFQMASTDMCGLLSLCEHKPTAPNQAPPRVVKQLLRQSIMQSVMEGHCPVIPADVYLDNGDARDQGTALSSYRFWGSVADYGDLFTFIRANAAMIDGYDKLAAVHLAVCNDTFPFRDGSGASAFDRLCARAGELWAADVDYHLLPVGEPTGALAQTPNAYAEANAPLVIKFQDESDYGSFSGRLSGSRYRKWSSAAVNEAMGHSPVRSTNLYVRATARYNASTGRVSVHLHNYAVNADGTPNPQTTTLLWNWGGAGGAAVTRLGESSGTVDLSSGSASISLTEYAIVNFAAA